MLIDGEGRLEYGGPAEIFFVVRPRTTHVRHKGIYLPREVSECLLDRRPGPSSSEWDGCATRFGAEARAPVNWRRSSKSTSERSGGTWNSRGSGSAGP